MSINPNTEYRTEKVTEWVSAGDLAVAVEVEAIYPPDAPNEPCYRPETVKLLEHLRRSAERGDIAELERAGRVYERRVPVGK
jgi:hypothetical protein